jgi:UDP-3-O-[3-hydroxymyristoyl] glucosamine N-acyltransferase
MADPHFFQNHGPFTIQEIVEWTGCELLDNAGEEARQTRMEDVSPLDRATPVHMSFFDNAKYLEQFKQSSAGACFVKPKYGEYAPDGMIVLLAEDPYRCYAMTAQRFYPRKSPQAEISPRAIIAETATLGANCRIEAGAVIGEHVSIADDCIIGANSVIDQGVKIGKGTQIGACCTISHSLIGRDVILHRGVHIGQDGFGFALGRGGHVKVPQLGRVIVEDRVEVGSGTCIDRGTGPDTLIGEGSKIDNLVQIGHNVQIGKGAVIVAQVGISGSSRIGDGAVLAGQAGIAGHLKIGAGARIAAQSGVMQDVPPGSNMGGSPAFPVKDWHRQTVTLSKLAKRKGESHG